MPDALTVGATEALERLKAGNERFVAGQTGNSPAADRFRRLQLVDEQRPFAIILGCSDSRVPAEIVFDQGLGDLFVIRVAGNVVAPSQIGSIEFAAESFGTQLVVVLGHADCGAVKATLEQVRTPRAQRSRNLASIVNRIRPAVSELVAGDRPGNAGDLLDAAVRANVSASVDQLRHGSEILEELIDAGALQIVGADYSLQTGRVEFLN